MADFSYLHTNCFEIRQNGLNLRAMYRTACILSHECRPNTRHTFSPDNSVNLYSTVNIGKEWLMSRVLKQRRSYWEQKWNISAKGDMITASYTQPLWTTYNRREHLKMSKCFWCQCPRCEDPTEFGSYLSCLNCPNCGGKVLSTNPLDQEAKWK